jgi:hypothetical protein
MALAVVQVVGRELSLVIWYLGISQVMTFHIMVTVTVAHHSTISAHVNRTVESALMMMEE